MNPLDIAQIMPLLQSRGIDPSAVSPLGALQGGPGYVGPIGQPMLADVAPPDFNAILQQRMVEANAQRQAMQQQRLQQFAQMLGQRTGGAMEFDPTMGRQGMRQQFQDWRQAGNKPVGFGANGMGRPQMGASQGAPMAGQAQLPTSGLGAGQWGGSGQVNARAQQMPAANINPDVNKQKISPY